MTHFIKPIPFKPPRLIGLSERLLASHYENQYGQALRQLNAIAAKLRHTDWPAVAGFRLAGLMREELIAANSVTLHEVYFDSLGGEDGLGSPAVEPTGELANALARDFGTVAQWREQFTGIAKGLAGSGGWVVLSWSTQRNRLINQWLPDYGHALADGFPIIALDMYEHAYHLDFGSDASAYLDAYLQNMHWARPAIRFAAACRLTHPLATATNPSADTVRPEQLQQMLACGEAPELLDVCLREDIAKRYDRLPGARFLQAEDIDQWIDSIPVDRPIIVNCMYGYQVSRQAANRLRDRGLDARILAGGIAAWRAIGGNTETLASSAQPIGPAPRTPEQ